MQKIKTFFRTNKLDLIQTTIALFLIAMFIIHIPFTASAYSTYPYTVTLTNPENLPLDNGIQLHYWLDGEQQVDAFGTHTITRQLYDDLITVSNSRVVDGIPLIDVSQGQFTWECIGDIPVGTYLADYMFFSYEPNIDVEATTYSYGGFGQWDLGDLGVVGMFFFLDVDNQFTVSEVDVSIGDISQYTVLRPISLEPDPEPTCPTLQEQLASYNGSWYEFEQMLKSTNYDLWLQYSGELTDVGSIQYGKGFNAGKNSVTLADKIAEYEGSWNEFVGIIALNNVRLQTLYVNEITRVEDFAWDDGYTIGKDEGHTEGYTEGYANGLNKGQSENVTKNFFGNFINGVIDVVDHIHFYEEYNEKGEVTFYLSPWSIVLVVLMVAIVIIILKVFAGG